MTVALYGEGPSDRDALKIIAESIMRSEHRMQPVVSNLAERGQMFNPRKMKALIDALIRTKGHVEKVVICKDSHGDDPEEMNGRANEIERQLARVGFPFPIKYVIVVHALESWLRGDPEAVGEFVGIEAERKIPGDSNLVCRPADVLHSIFKTAERHKKRGYEKTKHAPELAKKLRPEVVGRRSESFAAFRRAVSDP